MRCNGCGVVHHGADPLQTLSEATRAGWEHEAFLDGEVRNWCPECVEGYVDSGGEQLTLL